MDEMGVEINGPSQDGESEPEEEEEEGVEHPEEGDPLFNWDGSKKQPTSKKKGTPEYTKTQTRWNREMHPQLASLVSVKKPYMKENTKIGKGDAKKVWHHIWQGLLKLPRFASGVSEKQCKKIIGSCARLSKPRTRGWKLPLGTFRKNTWLTSKTWSRS